MQLSGCVLVGNCRTMVTFCRLPKLGRFKLCLKKKHEGRYTDIQPDYYTVAKAAQRQGCELGQGHGMQIIK